MNKPSNNIKFKLFLAVKELATGEGDIRKRLDFSRFHLYGLAAEDFPEELQEDWIAIQSFFTKESVQGIESPKWDALDKMSVETCVDLANRICKLMWDSVYPISDRDSPTF